MYYTSKNTTVVPQCMNCTLVTMASHFRNQKGNLVVKLPMRNNAFTVMLQMTYPNHGLLACEDSEVSDNLLHMHLALKCKCPNTAFGTGENKEPVSLFNWHWRMGHCSMKLRQL